MNRSIFKMLVCLLILSIVMSCDVGLNDSDESRLVNGKADIGFEKWKPEYVKPLENGKYLVEEDILISDEGYLNDYYSSFINQTRSTVMLNGKVWSVWDNDTRFHIVGLAHNPTKLSKIEFAC
jgi:hypothetical protein